MKRYFSRIGFITLLLITLLIAACASLVNHLEEGTFLGHMDDVNSVAFSPDGKILVSGSWDKTIKLWKADTGMLITTLTSHTESVTSVAFSSDGATLASGSEDGTNDPQPLPYFANE